MGPELGVFVLDVDGPEGERTLVALERRYGTAARPVLPAVDRRRAQWVASLLRLSRRPKRPEQRWSTRAKVGHPRRGRLCRGSAIAASIRTALRMGRRQEAEAGAARTCARLADRPSRPARSPEVLIFLCRREKGDDRYVEKALTTELKLTARAPEGERNDQLFESAVSLLRFVADGRLPLAAVTIDLRDAARTARLPEIEIARTLKSAAARRGIAL